ncbi:hypothetical protein EMIHUDRAFT_446559, partial [Emiliania huxleyi CCMP1516]|uniref:Uncharacterized protein n=2 Tax=Emiliania huxleyi TaxID=2903 RepID=A0A0D3I429_EMIH1
CRAASSPRYARREKAARQRQRQRQRRAEEEEEEQPQAGLLRLGIARARPQGEEGEEVEEGEAQRFGLAPAAQEGEALAPRLAVALARPPPRPLARPPRRLEGPRPRRLRRPPARRPRRPRPRRVRRGLFALRRRPLSRPDAARDDARGRRHGARRRGEGQHHPLAADRGQAQQGLLHVRPAARPAAAAVRCRGDGPRVQVVVHARRTRAGDQRRLRPPRLRAHRRPARRGRRGDRQAALAAAARAPHARLLPRRQPPLPAQPNGRRGGRPRAVLDGDRAGAEAGLRRPQWAARRRRAPRRRTRRRRRATPRRQPRGRRQRRGRRQPRARRRRQGRRRRVGGVKRREEAPRGTTHTPGGSADRGARRPVGEPGCPSGLPRAEGRGGERPGARQQAILHARDRRGVGPAQCVAGRALPLALWPARWPHTRRGTGTGTGARVRRSCWLVPFQSGTARALQNLDF